MEAARPLPMADRGRRLTRRRQELATCRRAAQAAVTAAGDNYKARKAVAEQMVLKKLGEGKWRDFFLSKAKRSDLADCFLMCLR